MKKALGILTVITLATVFCATVQAKDERSPMDFKNKVRFHQATSVEDSGSLDIESGGTLKIAGTAMTASAAALNAAGAGTTDPTIDDINMSGAVGDSLGFNITQAGIVTGLTATVKLDVSGVPTDTDYVVQKLFVMDNDNTQEVSWCEVRTVIDDARDTTEDGAFELWTMVNGTLTKVLDFTAGVGSFPLTVTAASVGTGLTVAQGGTGAATLTDGGVLLGSGTAAVTAMAVLTDGQMIVGDGTTDPVAESGATLRTSIGVGTGDTPQLTGIEVGAATDTTLLRSGAGDLTVEGKAIYRAGGTDVVVADGGTGLGSGTSGGVLAYTAAGTLASSALLTQYGPVIGGGAGVAPSAIAVGVNNQVLKGATGAAPAFGALVDADIPDDITATSYVPKTDVIGSVAMSVAYNNETNGVVEMQLKTEAGANPGAMYPATVWVSKTALGTPDSSDMDVASSLTTGTAIYSHSGGNDIYTALTDADGKISWAFVSSNPAFTNFFYCAVGGVVIGVQAAEIPGTP